MAQSTHDWQCVAEEAGHVAVAGLAEQGLCRYRRAVLVADS